VVVEQDRVPPHDLYPITTRPTRMG
jgi:hypothetical protein